VNRACDVSLRHAVAEAIAAGEFHVVVHARGRHLRGASAAAVRADAAALLPALVAVQLLQQIAEQPGRHHRRNRAAVVASAMAGFAYSRRRTAAMSRRATH
jgi:hypothetical protein